MTDLTASKPMKHSADVDSADAQGIPEGEHAVENASNSSESELVLTLQRFLRDQGEAYSEAAIRDLPATPSATFSPAEMVSVLREIGYVASFGNISTNNLSQSHCPMIGFWEDGSSFILTEIKPDGTVKYASTENKLKIKRMSKDQFSAKFSGHLILARRDSNAEAKSSKRWFYSAFAQGKWLYIQVILAATMSNFLGVSTSIFVMVVYDRVVPNEAIESLIALSIGVMIALGFDFLTKSLRANFIDRASKRADARMSRMVFDKILTLRLDSGNQSSGGVASVVREFDTLREFFTSATLVAIVDLPFIFLLCLRGLLDRWKYRDCAFGRCTLRVDHWRCDPTYLSPPRLRIHANRHVETSRIGRNFKWFGYNTSDRLRTLDEKPF